MEKLIKFLISKELNLKVGFIISSIYQKLKWPNEFANLLIDKYQIVTTRISFGEKWTIILEFHFQLVLKL